MQQPRRLWRKIGLQKNFLEGTSHSDESKNTQFQESFIKSQLSQRQDLQNSSFLRMKNQQNNGQIATDQVQNKSKQTSEIMESQSNCQTPIQILMTDSAIQSKYHLWENQHKIITSSINKNKQNKDGYEYLMHGHVRYNSMGSYINIDDSHFSDVIQTYGRKEQDTVQNINNEINQLNEGGKQRVSKGDESKGDDLSERREITYQSYPLSLSVNKQQQIIKIRLMELKNYQIKKDLNDQINQDYKYQNQRDKKVKGNNQMEYQVGSNNQMGYQVGRNKIQLQLMSKKERVIKLQQQLNAIKHFISTNLSFQYKELKQNHHVFKQLILNSLNQINLFMRTVIEQQFQQHISQLNDQIAYLYKQNEQLMLKIQHKQLSTKRVIDQNLLLNNTLSEYEHNKLIQLKQSKQTITNLQNHINSLQQKLQDLQDLEDYQKHKSTLLNQIKTYQGKIKTYDEQKIKYEEQFKRIQTQNKTYQTQVKKYGVQIKRLQTQINIFQTQIKQNKLSQSLLTDKVKELSVELTTKQLKIQELQWEITQSKANQNQIKQLQLKIAQLNQQNQSNFNKLTTQIQQQKSYNEKLLTQHERQVSYLRKQTLNFDDLKKQLSRMKQQTNDIVQMGQLLQTLLSESLRHNSLTVITNIQKEYNLKEYETLFTMFAFIKQEIHHNNNNNNNFTNNIMINDNNKNIFQSNLQMQKYPQISPKDSIANQQQKNTLVNQPRTLNNESSTNLLRKTGYFGEPQSHQFPLNLTLHDIQKNYSTQIPEQSQPQHYQQENDNKRVKMQQMRQFQKNRGMKYFGEQMNTNKNVHNFDSDRVSFIDLKRQQSLKGMQNINKRMINPDDRNKTFLKDKNRGNSKEKVNGSKVNCNSFGIESVQYLGSDTSMTGYQAQKRRQRQFQLSNNQWRPTHGRNQSVQIGLSKSGLKYHEEKSKRYNLNAQIQEDLQIVKSAFEAQNDQVEDIESHESSYVSRNKQNKNNFQKRNNFNSKQKHQQFSIANPNYSFSEYNSNGTNNLRHHRHIFGDQSFLQQDDQFDTNQQDDGFDTQSVIISYKSKDYQSNTNKNHQTNRDCQTNRDSKNNNYNSNKINNSNNINAYTNKYPTISNKYHTQTDKRYINEQQNNNTSLTNSRLQIQKLPNQNVNFTHYGEPTQNHKTERENIIEKIKQRVKKKFRTSHSKHQPTYQTQQTPLIPSQPSYYVTPKSTYKKDYLHQNITKPSLISDRKDQNIFSSNKNNILAQFYERHRNVTPNPAYNSLTLNQKSHPLTPTQRNKSPSFHSASRSPSNTRSRSPSNSSSVTSKLMNKYQTGVGYTGGLSTKKNVPVGITPRSAFSRSLIEKPSLSGYSRKAGQIGDTNLAPTYQPKGTLHAITSRESNTGSYVRKY